MPVWVCGFAQRLSGDFHVFYPRQAGLTFTAIEHFSLPLVFNISVFFALSKGEFLPFPRKLHVSPI
jgi:hypothetical protein